MTRPYVEAQRRCEHDEDPRGVSAWQHRHGQPCYWCWLEAGKRAREMTRKMEQATSSPEYRREQLRDALQGVNRRTA